MSFERSCRCEVRISQRELDAWAKEAHKGGMTLSGFIRKKVNASIELKDDSPLEESEKIGAEQERIVSPKKQTVILCFGCKRKVRIGLPLESGCLECREVRGY